MIPERLASICGESWLDAGIQRAPTAVELAELAMNIEGCVDVPALVSACERVAAACGYVIRGRSLPSWRKPVSRWA